MDNEKFYIAQKESDDLPGIYFLCFAQITWQKKFPLLLRLDVWRRSLIPASAYDTAQG